MGNWTEGRLNVHVDHTLIGREGVANVDVPACEIACRDIVALHLGYAVLPEDSGAAGIEEPNGN